MAVRLTRPSLNPAPLADVLPPRRGLAYVTISRSQWDALLQAAYDAGWVLLEMDDGERPVAAYRRPDVTVN